MSDERFRPGACFFTMVITPCDCPRRPNYTCCWLPRHTRTAQANNYKQAQAAMGTAKRKKKSFKKKKKVTTRTELREKKRTVRARAIKQAADANIPLKSIKVEYHVRSGGRDRGRRNMIISAVYPDGRRRKKHTMSQLIRLFRAFAAPTPAAAPPPVVAPADVRLGRTTKPVVDCKSDDIDEASDNNDGVFDGNSEDDSETESEESDADDSEDDVASADATDVKLERLKKKLDMWPVKNKHLVGKYTKGQIVQILVGNVWCTGVLQKIHCLCDTAARTTAGEFYVVNCFYEGNPFTIHDHKKIRAYPESDLSPSLSASTFPGLDGQGVIDLSVDSSDDEDEDELTFLYI